MRIWGAHDVPAHLTVPIGAAEGAQQAPYRIDRWRHVNLAQRSRVYGLLPGQTDFYFDLYGTIFHTLGDVRALSELRPLVSQALQVQRHDVKGYRHQVGVYEVTPYPGIRVPFGRCIENAHLGRGGARQFFIPRDRRWLVLLHQYSFT